MPPPPTHPIPRADAADSPAVAARRSRFAITHAARPLPPQHHRHRRLSLLLASFLPSSLPPSGHTGPDVRAKEILNFFFSFLPVVLFFLSFLSLLRLLPPAPADGLWLALPDPLLTIGHFVLRVQVRSSWCESAQVPRYLGRVPFSPGRGKKYLGPCRVHTVHCIRYGMVHPRWI